MRSANLFWIVVITQVGLLSGLHAQSPASEVAPVSSTLARTEPGTTVVAFLSDPFMSAEQESKILELMRRPCPFQWDGATTLVDIRRDLVEHVAIEIDWRSFEEIGIDPRHALYPELGTDSARTTVGVAASPDDPFANAVVSTSPATAHKKQISSHSMWWRQQKYSSSPMVVSTAARLLFFLDQLDATITIRQGQLIMTTVEGSEQQCCVRVYDVTPMIDVDSPSRYYGARWHRGSMVDGQSLIDTIQMAVDPDTWECMGGPSSLNTVACRDRQWLVAATPLVTHWKIQALLDKLNQ